MFREICLVLAISFTVSRAYCQSFNAADLIKLINLSDSQITRFLTNDKHFILLSNKTIGNEMTKTFVTNNNITEIILTTRAKNATRNYKIEYDVDPKSYADSIIQQLIKMKFKLNKSIKMLLIYKLHFHSCTV